MSIIKLTLLGTTAGVPTKERSHTAIHVSHDDGEGYSFLFDCGEGTQRQLLIAGLNMMKINDIFITHWHGDHCLGLPGLIDTLGFDGRKRPLTVYAPEAGRVRKMLRALSSMKEFKVVARNVVSKGKKISVLFQTERLKVVSIPVEHSVPAAAYALIENDKRSIDIKKALILGLPEKGEVYKAIKEKGKIEINGRVIRYEDISSVHKGKKIVYSGDTEICDNLENFIRDADLLIQDCTYFEKGIKERSYKHASLEEVINMSLKNNVKKIILTHIGRRYNDTNALKELIKGDERFSVAEDFMTVVV